MKAAVKRLLEKDKKGPGKQFAIAINALIILSLVSFSLETLPDLSDDFRHYLRWFEIFSVTVFTLEYLGRIWVADRKIEFVFSFYGIVDLLAILPFYLAIGVDLRSLRIIRLLRLFRILKIARYSTAMDRIYTALLSIREELVLFGVLTVFLLYVAATGIYYFENPAQPEQFASVFHSLWWAVATLTTVGYGDVYPITVGGRIFTFFVLLLGLGILAIPSGLFASALTDITRETIRKDE